MFARWLARQYRHFELILVECFERGEKRLGQWFERRYGAFEPEVQGQGRDEYLVRLPGGEVTIYAEMGRHPDRYIYPSTVKWRQPDDRVLTEEERQLAVEKLCAFFESANKTFEIS